MHSEAWFTQTRKYCELLDKKLIALDTQVETDKWLRQICNDHRVADFWIRKYSQELGYHIAKIDSRLQQQRMKIASIQIKDIPIRTLQPIILKILNQQRGLAIQSLMDLRIRDFEARYIVECGTYVITQMAVSHQVVKTKWVRVLIGIHRLMRQHCKDAT